MIDNYNDDKAMAKYGRTCAKFKAIRDAQQSIRDMAVMIGHADGFEAVEAYRNTFNAEVDSLIAALKL